MKKEGKNERKRKVMIVKMGNNKVQAFWDGLLCIVKRAASLHCIKMHPLTNKQKKTKRKIAKIKKELFNEMKTKLCVISECRIITCM